jgi:hypothetical protein
MSDQGWIGPDHLSVIIETDDELVYLTVNGHVLRLPPTDAVGLGLKLINSTMRWIDV